MTQFEVVDLPADRLPGEVLVVPLFADQRPLAGPVAVVDWRLDGTVTRMILAGELSGRQGEVLAMPTNAKFAAPWVMITGCGRWRTLDCRGYSALAGRLLKLAARAGIRELALCLPLGDGVAPADVERIVREALVASSRLAVCRLSRGPQCV
jgi:hypothetical protein